MHANHALSHLSYILPLKKANLDGTGRRLSSCHFFPLALSRQAFSHWLSLGIGFFQLSQSVISYCTKPLAINCQMSGFDNDHSGFRGAFLSLWVKVRKSIIVITCLMLFCFSKSMRAGIVPRLLILSPKCPV